MNATFSPRVVGPNRPDVHCLECFLASPPFAGKTGESLALALYDYLTSPRDGVYHFWPAQETAGQPAVRRTVSDPVKILNVYGWAICGQMSLMLGAIYRAAGLPARQIGLPGHCVCEVRYDDRWHVLDADMWTWFRTAAGHLASTDELAEDPDGRILHNPRRSDPCDLPDRKLDDYATMYRKAASPEARARALRPLWTIAAHEMDFRLRPGETLRRSATPGGRFHVPADWVALKEKFTREWPGHPRERYEPFRTYGNGRWTYRPQLGAAWADLARGRWRLEAPQDARGLRGPGDAEFDVVSPYPFVGTADLSGASGAAPRHRDGVWLELAGQGPLRAHVTDPSGQWRTVLDAPAGAFHARPDITELLESRYEARVKLHLQPGACLEALAFDGCILTAPLSLPRLAQGDNPMELRCGDRFGLSTVPVRRVLDFREGLDVPAQFESLAHARLEPYALPWRQLASDGTGPLTAVARLEAPPHRPLAWAYVHAQIREAPPGSEPATARLDWSLDGQSWHPLAEAALSNTPNQWDQVLDARLRLPAPAAALLVRVTTPTALAGLELHGHALDQAGPGEALHMTHRWREGTLGRRQTVPPGQHRWCVRCGPDPRDHAIEMACPSVPR